MNVSIAEFVRSPAVYLDKIGDETVTIIKDGLAIAVLTKPSATPIADGLLGILNTGAKKMNL